MPSLIARFKANWKSGLTVSLVNIPLSVSLAVAAGSTPTAGIITAVWAGLVAALFGGSNFNIFGPAGALSGILAAYALAHGAASLPLLAIVSGILILVAYAAKLERFLIFVPGSAVQGFTLSVALVIGLGQINNALGLVGLQKRGTFIANLWESLRHMASFSPTSASLFCAGLLVLLIFLKFLPRLPGAIPLTFVGIALGLLSSKGLLPFHIQTLADTYGSISATLIQPPRLVFTMDLLSGAIAVAVVAVIETMLSAKIADGMTKTRHNERKEMLGLGLANIVSGAAGGLPATAVLARTALNVKSGASDSLSAATNAVLVALISAVFLGYFKYIPMSIIAAILVFLAVRMVEKEFFAHAWRRNPFSFWIAIAVAFICVYIDPVYGILTGTVAALLLFVSTISHGHFEAFLNSKKEGEVGHLSGTRFEQIGAESDILTYSISGQLAYLNSRAHVSRFEDNRFGVHSHVILRLKELTFIDGEGVEALNEIVQVCMRNRKDVALTGPSPEIDAVLSQKSSLYRTLKARGLVFTSSLQALAYFDYDLHKHGLA